MKLRNFVSGALMPARVFVSVLAGRVSFGVMALAFGLLATSQASASSFSAFYSFGDSTIDSGWWTGALNGQCDGVTAPCATGSAGKNALIADSIANGGTGAPVGSTGLMRSQDIAAHYGLTAIPANQPGGTNYAISGSLSVAVGGDGNLNANANLPSAAGQIANYLGAHANLADPSALYLLSAGGNDITYSLQNFGTTAARQAFLTNQAAGYAIAIQTLQLAGAKTIVVDGQGPGFLAAFWNITLQADLSALNVKFIFADFTSLIVNVQNNPTLYGFTAATVLPGIVGTGTGSACVTQTGAGATTTGWGQWCVNSTDPSSTHAYLRSADAEQTSFYADDQHLSAAGQLILANYEIALIDSIVTPLPAALPLFATGLGALGLLGWRRKRKAKLQS